MKTSQQALAREVQSELITYLGSGTRINQDRVAMALDVTGLDIADFDRLKRIRFSLSKDVQTYIDKLDQRLRRIRTVNEVKSEVTRGDIRGAIDWGQTIRDRYENNPHDTTRFVTRSPQTKYQIPENILLKKLLSIVANTARDELLAIDQTWRRELWDDGEIESYLRLVDRNVHLNRIEATERTSLQPRQLNAVRQARQPLYYQAYERFQEYERLLNNDFSMESSRKLLYETLTIPETSRLFELASIFRLLRGFREYANVMLNPIEPGSDALAVGQTEDFEVVVYHDHRGSLTFKEHLPSNPQSDYLQKYGKVLERHRAFMDRTTLRPIYGGRPDIVIEFYDRNTDRERPVHVVIGEVKHTAREPVFSDGVQELFEYLTYARPSSPTDWGVDEYLLDTDDVSLRGMVITDGIDKHPPSGTIAHFNYEELATADYLTEVFYPLFSDGNTSVAGSQ